MPTYPLDEVTIDGFRGLRGLRLEGLGRLNVLVGPNNCGKTSVLEALSILCRPFDLTEWPPMLGRRDFGGGAGGRVQAIRWCFSQTDLPVDTETPFEGRCEMSCDGRFSVGSLNISCRDIQGYSSERADEAESPGSPPGDMQQGVELLHVAANVGTPGEAALKSVSKSHRFWDEPSEIVFRVGPVRRYRLPVATLTPFTYQIHKLSLSTLSEQLLEGLREAVVSLIREFDPEIEDIVVAAPHGRRSEVYLRHRRLGAAPLSVFGDALRRVVLLGGTLLKLRGGGLLLVDEIEAGIHVQALPKVFRWLSRAAEQYDVQVIAATHSLEAIDALAGDGEEEGDSRPALIVFRMNRTVDEVRVRRFAGELLHNLRYERGLDVR